MSECGHAYYSVIKSRLTRLYEKFIGTSQGEGEMRGNGRLGVFLCESGKIFVFPSTFYGNASIDDRLDIAFLSNIKKCHKAEMKSSTNKKSGNIIYPFPCS